METTKQQENDFLFYKENAIQLAQKYDNKYLVISHEKVVKDFDSIGEAYDFALSKFSFGNFIIQHSNYFESIQYISRLEHA